jgi:hypothetical protein
MHLLLPGGWLMFRLEMAALILALLKQVLWNQLVFLHVTSFLMTGVFAVLSLRVGCGWMGDI